LFTWNMLFHQFTGSQFCRWLEEKVQSVLTLV
jgi:hypothetical protein